MADPHVMDVKNQLRGAGIEVYRVRERTIEVAERIRLHIMDSGVRVTAEDPIQVRFTARSQRSGNPGMDDESLFGLVRTSLGPAAEAQGFREEDASSQPVLDPVDGARVLDVWYEVTYCRAASGVEEAAALVQWALSLERFVGASAAPD